jgi:hypothetical protein
MASKVFQPPLRFVADVERWMAVLGSEIYMRIMDDFEERSRWPKTLVVSSKLLSSEVCRLALIQLQFRSITVVLVKVLVDQNHVLWLDVQT